MLSFDKTTTAQRLATKKYYDHFLERDATKDAIYGFSTLVFCTLVAVVFLAMF